MGRKPKGWADARAMPEVHQNIRVFMRVIQNRIPKAGKKSRAKPEVLQIWVGNQKEGKIRGQSPRFIKT